MIKFSGMTGEDKRGRLIGIGLSRRNCEKLLEGDPILFELEVLGLRVTTIGEPYPRRAQVLIVAGETEEAILAELKATASAAGVTILDAEPKG